MNDRELRALRQARNALADAVYHLAQVPGYQAENAADVLDEINMDLGEVQTKALA